MIDTGFINEETDVVDEAADSSHVEFSEEDLTPQGRFRSEVLDDPNFVWKLPDKKFLEYHNDVIFMKQSG